MTPWLDDGDVQLHHGDVLDVLAALPAGIAQTCVTSPPYWGLRDYGTGQWDGGDPTCSHTRNHREPRDFDGGPGSTSGCASWSTREVAVYADVCGRCGARRVDRQIGLEASPQEYVERMVEVFRGVWRVLRDDGVLWLNLGDSYATGTSTPSTPSPNVDVDYWKHADKLGRSRIDGREAGLKPKDLVGIPWRVAFALQADGWYLRSDVIWSKPNPMPESVTDRPTKAHEYLFLLSKRPRYFYDADAIREPHNGLPSGNVESKPNPAAVIGNGDTRHSIPWQPDVAGRNRRSVWTVATQPFPEAHFATFPEALVAPCILAGTSERGECVECGAPWVRETEAEYVKSRVHGAGSVIGRHQATGANGWDGSGLPRLDKKVTTTGWRASCSCDAPTRPQLVLDPFIGSGTTALVARKHGRRCIGIDLSEEYLGIAARRLQQLSLFATQQVGS